VQQRKAESIEVLAIHAQNYLYVGHRFAEGQWVQELMDTREVFDLLPRAPLGQCGNKIINSVKKCW
jgi:hypothetical protein